MPEKLSDPYVATVDANAAAAETNVPPTPTKNASTLRRREGASVRDVEGSISKQSVQTVFVPSDGSPPMNLLENQMLERVEAMLESAGPNAGRIRWRLSGKVTEYRGANYLLLSTASQIDTAVQP
jgi:hypothetical protein